VYTSEKWSHTNTHSSTYMDGIWPNHRLFTSQRPYVRCCCYTDNRFLLPDRFVEKTSASEIFEHRQARTSYASICSNEKISSTAHPSEDPPKKISHNIRETSQNMVDHHAKSPKNPWSKSKLHGNQRNSKRQCAYM
jgi:hypothetical protein